MTLPANSHLECVIELVSCDCLYKLKCMGKEICEEIFLVCVVLQYYSYCFS